MDDFGHNATFTFAAPLCPGGVYNQRVLLGDYAPQSKEFRDESFEILGDEIEQLELELDELEHELFIGKYEGREFDYSEFEITQDEENSRSEVREASSRRLGYVRRELENKSALQDAMRELEVLAGMAHRASSLPPGGCSYVYAITRGC